MSPEHQHWTTISVTADIGLRGDTQQVMDAWDRLKVVEFLPLQVPPFLFSLNHYTTAKTFSFRHHAPGLIKARHYRRMCCL